MHSKNKKKGGGNGIEITIKDKNNNMYTIKEGSKIIIENTRMDVIELNNTNITYSLYTQLHNGHWVMNVNDQEENEHGKSKFKISIKEFTEKISNEVITNVEK